MVHMVTPSAAREKPASPPPRKTPTISTTFSTRMGAIREKIRSMATAARAACSDTLKRVRMAGADRATAIPKISPTSSASLEKRRE